MKSFTSETKDYLKKLYSAFDSKRDVLNASPMKAYMKNHFEFFGVKATERRMIVKNFIIENGLPENKLEFITKCWSYPEREMQIAGMEILFKMKKKIKKTDVDLLEFMIVNKSWWDSVDFIAANIVGHYFFTFPEEIKNITGKWSVSENIWLNRTCILFQLKYKEYTDFKLLQSFIHRHKYSKEFFLQKAIGWALRQYAKTSPKEVRAFVAETELKPLSRREALKHFS